MMKINRFDCITHRDTHLLLHLFEQMKQQVGLIDNKKLSKIFQEMADCYAYLGPAQKFRRRAYENASRLLMNMHEPIIKTTTDNKHLEAMAGIGKSIASNIQEFVKQGEIAKHIRLKNEVPFDLMELMHTKGIGPATIHALEDCFQVQTKDALKELIKNNTQKPKGFGEKRMTLLRDALHIGIAKKKRYPLTQILPIADNLTNFIRHIPHIEQVTVAGSIRRRKETVGDIDIIVSCHSKYAKDISDRLVLYTGVSGILSKGKTKISMRIGANQTQCDIRLINPDSYGSALIYFTGSKEHNILLRLMAKKRGLKINEYGVFDAEGNKIAGKTETEVYTILGLSFIPPEKRTGDYEMIEAKIPEGKSDVVW